MMKMSEAQKVPVVFGEVGTADPVFHLSSECEAIPSEGVRPLRWDEARAHALGLLPRFCEACGPKSATRA